VFKKESFYMSRGNICPWIGFFSVYSHMLGKGFCPLADFFLHWILWSCRGKKADLCCVSIVLAADLLDFWAYSRCWKVNRMGMNKTL